MAIPKFSNTGHPKILKKGQIRGIFLADKRHFFFAIFDLFFTFFDQLLTIIWPLLTNLTKNHDPGNTGVNTGVNSIYPGIPVCTPVIPGMLATLVVEDSPIEAPINLTPLQTGLFAMAGQG